jgi:hypothetical protein
MKGSYMKKILSTFLALTLMALNVIPALAAISVADVSSNYWAAKEIGIVLDNGILTLDSAKKFSPEAPITRAEFVGALLKVLANDKLTVKVKNNFSDLNSSDSYYLNVLRSDQLGLVYGYPDGTFKPLHHITRAETQSVISHITKESTAGGNSVLAPFSDAAKIPAWAKAVYIKTINYGIYVNHPDKNELRPGDDLTRAEAAVLLARLKEKLSLVKEQYKGTETLLGIEHLDTTKKAPTDEVKITNLRNIILEGNVLAVAFDAKFKSDKQQPGDVIHFVTDKDIFTKEGTLLIPSGSQFVASVLEIKDPKWFNKNARAYLQISKIIFPNGKQVALSAKPFYKDYALKEGPWMTAGKLALCTVSGGAVGTGAGVGFAFIPDPTKIGTGIAIGAPVGAAVGLVTGLVTPGLNYHAKKGEQIFVILLDDASITK